MRKIKINWNGFLKIAVEEYPKEACAFLFAERPYSDNEEWVVFPVKNISENPENEWKPDRKEMQKVKQMAKLLNLVKIGNIHTHPYPADILFDKKYLSGFIHPSVTDLKFASRFNDIVRGIILVSKDSIHGVRFHDMFDNEIEIYSYALDEVSK
jgi:hypothetical protein